MQGMTKYNKDPRYAPQEFKIKLEKDINRCHGSDRISCWRILKFRKKHIVNHVQTIIHIWIPKTKQVKPIVANSFPKLPGPGVNKPGVDIGSLLPRFGGTWGDLGHLLAQSPTHAPSPNLVAIKKIDFFLFDWCHTKIYEHLDLKLGRPKTLKIFFGWAKT